jgi:ribosomal RNA-processing protein 9
VVLDRVKAYQDAEDEEALSDGEDGRHAAVADRLKQEALDSMGHLRRKLAHRLALPPLPLASEYSAAAAGGRFFRGGKLAVTATALTHDDRTVYSVSKDGCVFELDVESGARRRFAAGGAGPAARAGPEWVSPSARQGSAGALLAAAVSSDGRYLAAGGGGRVVHVWDARSGAHLRAFPGHKDAVTALAFREGTHQLFSGSLDRSIKSWELDDMAYVDTLFGHQAEVLSLDALRGERVLSAGADRTCRVWKIPEESQLVFRGHCLTMECARYVAGGDWVSGSADGGVQLWTSTKKKPVHTAWGAHFDPAAQGDEARGAGAAGGAATAWVGAVAVCRGADLVASGAGDGAVRLWRVADAGPVGSGKRVLEALGGLPVRGFVNSLNLARSGRFLVAGVGQEPRMGRWLRDGAARNGVLVHPLELRDEGAAGGGSDSDEGGGSE